MANMLVWRLDLIAFLCQFMRFGGGGQGEWKGADVQPGCSEKEYRPLGPRRRASE